MKPLHIFKPGRHTPANGAALTFSESDLAASARAYDPALHEAPIVIGHPVHDAPAHGWIGRVQANATGLRATPRQVSPEFAELVRQGSYKKISASFYAPDAPGNPVPGVYYLRHVGFLGAQPPSVKGLESVDLSESEQGVVSFAEGDGGGSDDERGFFQKMRDWLVKNKGSQVADSVLPQDTAETLEEDPQTADAVDDVQVRADATADELVPDLVQKIAEQAEEIQTLREEAQSQDEGEDVREFAERLVQSGRIRPRHRATVVAFMEFASGRKKARRGGVLEFSEHGVRRPMLPAFKSFLNSLPKSTDFSEAAPRGRAAPSRAEVNPLVADAERRAKTRN